MKGLGLWTALLLAMAALGAQRPARTLLERAAQSDRVVLATVTDRKVQESRATRLVTVTTLLVERDLRGEGPAQVELVQAGGTQGPLHVAAPGAAVLLKDARGLFFLRCQKSRCALVDLGAGFLPVIDGRVRTASSDRPLAEVLSEVRAR